MTTNKIALKPQNSVIAVSNLTKYLLTPTSDLYYYYIVLHHTTTANVIFTIVFFRVSKEASQGGIEWVFFFLQRTYFISPCSKCSKNPAHAHIPKKNKYLNDP